MTNDKMKAIKIVDELISFYFSIEITNIHIDIRYGEKEIEISLEGNCCYPPNKKLSRLQELLNAPRQEELEDYYWELVGENDHYEELSLLGALVDSGNVEYENNKLKITVYKKR